MSTLINRLKSDFQDTETRHVYVDEFLNYSLATQIQVLREQRRWSPQYLAETANLSCSNVEDLEDVSYSSWAIDSLKRLARVFDVVLKVSFVSFGERLKDIDQLSRESLECLPFDNDPVFSESNQPLADIPELITAWTIQERENYSRYSLNRFQTANPTGALRKALSYPHTQRRVRSSLRLGQKGRQRRETTVSGLG